MRDYLIKRPMLLCGICCCIISVIGFYHSGALAFIMLILSLLIGILIYKKANARLIFVSALIFVMCLSCILTSKQIERLSYYGSNAGFGEFTVISTDYRGEEYYASTAQVIKSDTLPEGTKLTVFYEPQALESGGRISADIRVKKIEDTFDRKNSYSRGIYLKGNLSNIKKLSGKEDFILSFSEKIKSYIKNRLFENLSYKEASTLCALLFGNRDYFTNEFYGYVKSAGVSHVMVVSGMHMSIIIALIIRLSEKIFYNPFIRAFTVIITVIFLCLICGFTMSILRAGVTYLIMAIGIMLDRKGKSENSLGAAITLILIFSPFAVFSISLQLSALSTFGILAIALPVTDYIKEKGIIRNPFILGIMSSVLITLSATLLTFPTSVNTFGYVSTVSVLSNLLISAAVTLALYFSIAALVFSAIFPFASNILYIPASAATKYINYIIEAFGSLSLATVDVPKYVSFIAAFAIFTVLTGLLACKKRRNMLRLDIMRLKILKEGGGRLKWRYFLRMPLKNLLMINCFRFISCLARIAGLKRIIPIK